MSMRKPVDPGPARGQLQYAYSRGAGSRTTLPMLPSSAVLPAASAWRWRDDAPAQADAGWMAGLSDRDFADRMGHVPVLLTVPAVAGSLLALAMGFSPLWMLLAAFVVLAWGTAANGG